MPPCKSTVRTFTAAGARVSADSRARMMSTLPVARSSARSACCSAISSTTLSARLSQRNCSKVRYATIRRCCTISALETSRPTVPGSARASMLAPARCRSPNSLSMRPAHPSQPKASSVNFVEGILRKRIEARGFMIRWAGVPSSSFGDELTAASEAQPISRLLAEQSVAASSPPLRPGENGFRVHVGYRRPTAQTGTPNQRILAENP
jgi:hypothetical protein